MIRIISKSLLQTINVQSCVFPELPDRHILWNAERWQLLFLVYAIKICFIPKGFQETWILHAGIDRPLSHAKILQNDCEVRSRTVDEVMSICSFRNAHLF